MSDIKLTINLSEQALMDLIDCLDVGIHNFNPEYRRYGDILSLYSRIVEAKDLNRKKVSFLYRTEVEE